MDGAHIDDQCGFDRLDTDERAQAMSDAMEPKRRYLGDVVLLKTGAVAKIVEFDNIGRPYKIANKSGSWWVDENEIV